MLQPMQQPAPTQPSPTSSNFAGLLAALASPQPAAQEDESLWTTSDLGEDVATLSYERALRTHARYRPPEGRAGREIDRGDRLSMPPASFEVDSGTDTAIETDAAGARPSLPASAATDRDLRSASVTIRMSKAECARLRRARRRSRADDLGVSALLRARSRCFARTSEAGAGGTEGRQRATPASTDHLPGASAGNETPQQRSCREPGPGASEQETGTANVFGMDSVAYETRIMIAVLNRDQLLNDLGRQKLQRGFASLGWLDCRLQFPCRAGRPQTEQPWG